MFLKPFLIIYITIGASFLTSCGDAQTSQREVKTQVDRSTAVEHIAQTTSDTKGTPIPSISSGKSSSIQISKPISTPSSGNLFNSINEIDPLTIKSEDIINILAKNGYSENTYYKVSNFNHLKRKDKVIWFIKNAHVRIVIADPDEIQPPPIRMIGFYFRDRSSWNDNRNITMEILRKIIPDAGITDSKLDQLQKEAESSKTEQVETKLNGISLRLAIFKEGDFMMSIIKRK